MSSPTPPRPLRILHLNSLLDGGGTDDQCLRLVAGLADLGQEVRLAGPSHGPLEPRIQQLRLQRLDTPTGRHSLPLSIARATARHCRQFNIDILHAHHGRDYWTAILAAHLSGRRPRLVLTRHLAKSPSSLGSRWCLLRQCDVLIAVSEFVARVLRDGVWEPESPVAERRSRPPLRGNHSKIRVVHGGIDAEQFQVRDASAVRAAWGLNPENVAFGVVGGYPRPHGKGQREFLKAAAHIAKDAPQARFLIIGSGDLAEVLKADMDELGLRGRAQLTPYCTDMPSAMNALDCLVHPQVATEAFGIVVLEAMACAKPVVVSRCDGVPEALVEGRHGITVPMHDVPALAAAMKSIAVDPMLRNRLGSASREHVLDHFTQGHLARRVLGVYQELAPTPVR